MPTLPATVGYGRVHGTILKAVTDTTSDPDENPDAAVPEYSVTFTASAKYVTHDVADVVIILDPITALVDPVTGFFSAKLVATDDPDINPTGFTWSLQIAVVGGITFEPINIDVPEGSDVDLTDLIPTAMSSGNLTMRGPAGATDVVIPFSYGGALQVVAGDVLWYNDFPYALDFVAVRAHVAGTIGVQPVIIDVNVNGTSIYTNQTNRPTVLPGTHTDLGGPPDVASVLPGQSISVDIDQVGGVGAEGSGLTVSLLLTGA